jgi:murein DD-endopeptidase MepM/ murein hydrolase activator NlpD
MKVDLDNDGDEQTGWVVMYLHLDWREIEGIYLGAKVEQGQVIGRPSCLRGRATDIHLHIARKYNGEWIEAGSAVPFNFEGWVVQNGELPYEGTMVRGDQVLTACTCGWQDAHLIRPKLISNTP